MAENNHAVRRGGVWLFLLIAFGWSWGLTAAAYFSSTEYTPLFAITYMAGPAIAAFTCAFRYDRHRFLASLGLSSNPFNRWLIVAFLAPLLISAFAYFMTKYLGGRVMLSPAKAFTAQINEAGVDIETLPLSVKQIAWIQIFSAPFVAALVNTIIMMMTEEVGWRGWLWDRWSHLPFWCHAVITGFIWGLWHAPLVSLGHNYPNMPVWGPIVFIAWVMLFTPLIAWVRECGGSMVHAAMFHGVFNGVAPITVILMADPSMPWRGVLGLGGLMAMAFGIAWVLLDRSKHRSKD